MASSILYTGPSLIDGQPIVVIATDGSKNTKTGGIVQTWILANAGVEPHHALKDGSDASVCGDCPHRPINGGACYVTVFQAPLSVYRAHQRGRYADFVPGQYDGRIVRIGSYGDPAAVPTHVWASFIAGTKANTGYTHQWRNASASDLGTYCMASCDNEADLHAARDAGWRTFRVLAEGEQRVKGEAQCPASHEAGQKLQCSQCKACDGNRTQRLGGIAINAHGSKAKVNAFNNARAQA